MFGDVKGSGGTDEIRNILFRPIAKLWTLGHALRGFGILVPEFRGAIAGPSKIGNRFRPNMILNVALEICVEFQSMFRVNSAPV